MSHSARRIVRKVEDLLIYLDRFDLPRKLSHGKPTNLNWSAVITGAVEIPIKRPKKPIRCRRRSITTSSELEQ